MQALLAVLTHNIVDLHAQPVRTSERVSQALLGDVVALIEGCESHARVRTPDGYEGWVDRAHFRMVRSGEAYGAQDWYVHEPRACRITVPAADVFSKPGGPRLTKLPLGAHVRLRRRESRDAESVELLLPTQDEARSVTVSVRSDAVTPVYAAPAFRGTAVRALAESFIGTPYLWGGITPFGFDCSGFVQTLYRAFGVMLPRDAYQQAACTLGHTLVKDAPMKAGDLVFLVGRTNPHGRRISHVGMATGRRRVIHASGRDGVTVDTIDDLLTVRGYALVSVWRYTNLPDRGKEHL